MGYLGLLFIFWAFTIFVQRAFWRLRKKTGKSKLGFYPTGASMGNALQVLQEIVHPHVKYVIEEKLDEDEDEDDETGPKDPTAHLMRQAKRIQRGETIDRITVFLP
jgi:hypothetical protein